MSIKVNQFFAKTNKGRIRVCIRAFLLNLRIMDGKNGKRPVRNAIGRLSERNQLLLLSLVVGVACGLASVLLKSCIGGIQHGLAACFGKGMWRFAYLFLPGIGMLMAMLFVKYIVKDDISHGVTKALVAVSKNESKIKPHNMWTSLAASSVTIGFGGSVGAEAPIVYTGAAIGSNVARWMGMSYRNMTILLGCGAAGAVAGIFKAPLAGVLFTLEILLFNISMSSILPLLISTISATVISYLLLGYGPVFNCSLEKFSMTNIPYYIILGLFCAAISVYFIRTTLWMEDRVKKIRNVWLRWLIAAAGLGLLIFFFPPLHGEGYEAVTFLLNGEDMEFRGKTVLAFFTRKEWALPIFIAIVLLLKVISMSLTNSGGGVGGTFGPTLVVGAFLGFVIAKSINLALAGAGVSVPVQNFVLVGMAGLMAGVMQAPMTAIFLIAEISGGYDLLIPLILTATISFGLTRAVEKYSIYSKRIAKTGELLTHDNDQAVLTLLRTGDLVRDKYPRIHMDATLGELVEIISESQAQVFPVVDSTDRFQGIVEMDEIRKLMFRTDLYSTKRVFSFMEPPADFIYDDESTDVVMRKFEKTQAWRLPVITRDRKYLGFISKSRLLSAYREELRTISHE